MIAIVTSFDSKVFSGNLMTNLHFVGVLTVIGILPRTRFP
jgi:hypothetical protein